MTDDLRAGRLRVPRAELEWRFDTPGGPGGQHANRAATRAVVRFAVAASPSLDEPTRRRLVAKLGPVVTVSAAEARSQAANRRRAEERLVAVLTDALRERRPRRPTRPGRAAKARRVDAKKRRGDLKRTRGRVRPDD